MPADNIVRVAAAQYAVGHLTEANALQRKIEQWVADAAGNGAKLLVFPEFAGMEFAALMDRRRTPDRRSPDRHKLGPLPVMQATRRKEPSLAWETDAIQAALPSFISFHAELAVRHAVYILSGSLPVRLDDDRVVNRAYFFTPEGNVAHQDKIIPTRWEREIWNISSGDEIRTFATAFGPIGVAICYDVEFPLIARLQAEAGARIILAPCCCDSLRGYYRVRTGARARALENQAYVVQSPAIGETEWSSVIGKSEGFAGIYAPPDLGPSPNGVMAQGKRGEPMWVYADLDLASLDRIRQGDGIIANESDWRSHLKFEHANSAVFSPVET